MFRRDRLGILPLLLLMLITMLAPMTFAKIKVVNGIKFYTGTGGPIEFNEDFYASKIYFEDNFLYFIEYEYNSKIWNLIGFQSASESANITINKIEYDRIDYTAKAPTDTTSTLKIYTGLKGRPENIVGSSSWGYESGKKILTINSLHKSPVNVVVIWKIRHRDWLNEVGFYALELLGLLIFMLGAYLLFTSIQGGSISGGNILDILLVAIIAGVGVLLLLQMISM